MRNLSLLTLDPVFSHNWKRSDCYGNNTFTLHIIHLPLIEVGIEGGEGGELCQLLSGMPFSVSGTLIPD